MQGVLVTVGVLIGGLLLGLVGLALVSRQGQPPGLQAGRLAACPASPNCVSSEPGTDRAHAVEPLSLPAGEDPRAALRAAVLATGGRLLRDEPHYLAAMYRSRLFGFVDDLELRPEPDAGRVQVRSASRVGHGDFGVNRQRVEALRKVLAAPR